MLVRRGSIRQWMQGVESLDDWDGISDVARVRRMKKLTKSRLPEVARIPVSYFTLSNSLLPTSRQIFQPNAAGWLIPGGSAMP